MKGLIIKDILNLKRSLITSLATLLFFSLIAYQSGDPMFLIGTFVIIISMQYISSISYDDLAKWDIYALTMPISRRKLVMSKYILSALLSIAALIISSAVAYFLILPVSNIGITEFLLFSYLIFFIALLLTSIMLPLIYKFGVERSRLLLFIVISIPVMIGLFLNKIGINLPNEDQFSMLIKISPFIIIIILFVSSLISCKIYKNKDM